MADPRVGDFVVYKDLPDTHLYRVCEIDGWGRAVIIGDRPRSFCRTVAFSAIEVVGNW